MEDSTGSQLPTLPDNCAALEENAVDRMQIYQNVLNTYSSAQKAGKKVELPPSIDKIAGILQEVPDKFMLPVIELVVACEYEPKVLEAVQKLFRERGLAGKPASKSPQARSESPKELMASLGQATD